MCFSVSCFCDCNRYNLMDWQQEMVCDHKGALLHEMQNTVREKKPQNNNTTKIIINKCVVDENSCCFYLNP